MTPYQTAFLLGYMHKEAAGFNPDPAKRAPAVSQRPRRSAAQQMYESTHVAPAWRAELARRKDKSWSGTFGRAADAMVPTGFKNGLVGVANWGQQVGRAVERTPYAYNQAMRAAEMAPNTMQNANTAINSWSNAGNQVGNAARQVGNLVPEVQGAVKKYSNIGDDIQGVIRAGKKYAPYVATAGGVKVLADVVRAGTGLQNNWNNQNYQQQMLQLMQTRQPAAQYQQQIPGQQYGAWRNQSYYR